MPNLWREQGRGQRGPQHHAHLLAGVLIGQNVDMGNAIDVETVTLDILNYAHDGRPWRVRVFSEPHLAAQRIAGWPILTSGAFINDGHRLFAVFIALSEGAAAYQRRLQHLKIVGAYPNSLGAQILRGLDRSIFNR